MSSKKTIIAFVSLSPRTCQKNHLQLNFRCYLDKSHQITNLNFSLFISSRIITFLLHWKRIPRVYEIKNLELDLCRWSDSMPLNHLILIQHGACQCLTRNYGNGFHPPETYSLREVKRYAHICFLERGESTKTGSLENLILLQPGEIRSVLWQWLPTLTAH